MPRNEVGEIEMALGNRQLLSVFFIVVALLGIFFTVGYIVGKSASPVLADSSRRSTSPLIVNSVASPSHVSQGAPAKAAEETKPPKKDAVPPQTPNVAAAISYPAPVSHSEPSAPPPSAAHIEARTAAAPQEAAKKEPAKSELPKNEIPQNRSNAPTNPAAAVAANGQSYLQLTATSKPDADKMVDVLRQKGFSTIAVEIRERPGTWRVLVGPVSDSGANLRSDLQKMGFPGNTALRRSF